MVDYIGDCRGNVRLPGIMMLGFVGAQSENLAMAVIVSKVSSSISTLCNRYLYVHQLEWLLRLGSGSTVHRAVGGT